MAKVERIREVLSKPLEPEYVKQRAEAGWKLVAVEWEHEVEADEKEPRRVIEDVPYGLRVGDDCAHLIENPAETQVLIRMLDCIVQDYPFSKSRTSLIAMAFGPATGPSGRPFPFIICCRASFRSAPEFSPARNGRHGGSTRPNSPENSPRLGYLRSGKGLWQALSRTCATRD